MKLKKYIRVIVRPIGHSGIEANVTKRYLNMLNECATSLGFTVEVLDPNIETHSNDHAWIKAHLSSFDINI